MKLGIMQPYFMPYLGYFQLMNYVDKYVVYDDVNFIKGGWINRNNLIVSGEKRMFTIKLDKASPNKLINEIDIKDNFADLEKTLKFNYAKAPYFNDVMELFSSIVSFEDRNLSNFIANSFKLILKYIGNETTEIIMSSSLDKDNSLKGKDKVISICKILGADQYVNAIGGQELYDKNEFAQNGIDLRFIETQLKEYSQTAKNKEFIPGLSFIDVLMNNSVEEINSIHLKSYKLI